MMKPRIYKDLELDTWVCEERHKPISFSGWWHVSLAPPVGFGDTPKEAFLNWYNQMVEQHIDE